ncbi:MAG: GtrA family protein [Rhodospirillaceae bacterium]
MTAHAAVRGQAIRFVAVGIVNTLVGYAIIVSGMEVLAMSPVAANVFGYCVGFGISFILHRRITFNHRGAVLPTIVRFALTMAIAYSCNLIVLLILINSFQASAILAQLMAVFVYTVVSFVLSRTIVFRS